jgi:hypothetical protein
MTTETKDLEHLKRDCLEHKAQVWADNSLLRCGSLHHRRHRPPRLHLRRR